MPKTLTPDQLRTQAAEYASKAAEAQDELDRLAAEEWQREQEQLAERDQQTVAAYDRAALDRNIDEAHQRFQQALTESPVVQALADYLAAQYRRNWAHVDVMGARDRLGLRPVSPTPPAYAPPLADAMIEAATRLAQSAIDTERAEG